MAVPLIAVGGAGAAGAGGAGMAAMAPAAAAMGPVGWAALGVMAVSTIMAGSAARKQAQYERYQMQLQENQARIDARNTLVDLGRELRYTRGSALASLGHGSAGIGQSFLAIRSDELNLYSRNVRNAELGSLAAQAEISAARSVSRARQSNERMLMYLDLVSQGVNAYGEKKRLQGPGRT